jgi:hypothetical protein
MALTETTPTNLAGELNMGKHYLNKLFEPRSVSLFGASDREGAVGNLVMISRNNTIGKTS